ncbi:oligosaccharide flippase family protein, partial [Halococcus hamelinensis]
VLSVSVVVVSAGTFDSARKFIAEQRETENWREHVFGFYARVVIVLGAIVGILFIVATQLGVVALVLNPAYEPYFYVLALLVPLQAGFKLSRSVLMGLDLESSSEPLYVLQQLLFALLALTLVWLGWSVVGALIGRLLAYLCVVVFMLVFIWRKIDMSEVVKIAPASFPRRNLLSYNVLTVVFKLLVTSLYNVDIILLGLLVGSTATGSYRAALVIAQFLWLIPTAVQVGLLHSTSRLWSDGENARISILSSRAARFTLLFTLLLVLGVAALAEPLVSLYFGEGFSRTPETVLYLLPGVLGLAVARPIFATSQGHGNLRPVLLATGSAAILNVVLNLVLIPRYGVTGAAIATSAGYGSMVVFHIRAAQTLGFNPAADLRLSRTMATAALTAIPIFGLSWLLEGIIQLIAVPPIGFVVYTILAFRTHAIELSEVRPLVRSETIRTLGQVLPQQIVSLFQRSLEVALGSRI